MIDIKDIKGNVILSTPINEGSKRKFDLMQSDHITLRFSLDTPIDFPMGCYVDTAELGRFERIDSAYKPNYNNTTGGYDYELQLDAYYRKWKNKIFKFTPEVGGQEASWSLTASLDVQMSIFLRNLKALGYTYRGTEFEFSIDSTVENKAIGMTYDNMNMLDALASMAESWECEWWVTDNIIHFGRCEYGTPVDFEINVNVESMSRSESKSTYATRIYAFGSTKNLPASYRPVDESVVVNGVVQRRLMLPEGTPYVDAFEGMTEEEAVEQVVIFEDVYPRTKGTIDSIETYEDTVENEDGTTTTETFYRFKDDGITFSKDYILEGEELKVKFESGLLNGMEFGVAFNPKGVNEKFDSGSWNPEAQLFEIVVNEDYGRKLPDSTLKPQVGDTYILSGWDSTKIAELGLVSKAENELLAKAQQYVEKSKIDPNTYPCKMMSDYMYGLDEEGNLDTHYAKHFEVGDRVNLINIGLFKDGRQSRIIGYEYNLDYPYDSPTYTVGETASYSRIGDIETKLEALTYGGITYKGGGGSGVYLIGTNDTTKPTNRNTYSSLRADQHFLKKDQPDTAREVITFEKGLNVGDFVTGASGASFFKDLTTGQTIMELDKLYVRMKAFFETLTIVEAQTISGKQIISPAGSVRCTNVEEYDDYYRCYFLNEQDGEKVENKFIVGDQVYSQMFNAKTGTSNKISNRYYWRLVTGVGENYIDLSKTDCDADSDAPIVGDVLNQRGHRYPENSERMNFIETSTVDGFSPSITLFHGVNSFSLAGKDYVQFGVDKTTNKALMNVYGDMYVGDRNKTAYMRYTQEEGLVICGKLDVGTKLGDSYLKDLISASTPEGYQEFVEKVTQDLEGLQAQIDGTIDSYFFQYEPSLDNYPASEWDTEIEKQSHLNDTFTNLVDGRSWRWSLDGTYKWVEITDTATTKALALAGKAQDTADGKRRVFVDTPYPPYDKGDLWSRGSNYPLLICVVPKESGVYADGDFDYADNNVKLKEEMQTLVTNTKSELNNSIGQAKEAANKYADEGIASAKEDINASIDELEKAKANVTEVYSKAEADGKITEAETSAINAAKAQAAAAIALSETTIKAYADGIVDDEEAERIKQAQENLAEAKKYAEEQAKAAKSEIENSYLFQALQDAQSTEIENGLVLTSLIQLRDTQSNIMSGINGLINASKGDKSIATWWGGDMLDLIDYYRWDGTQWVVKSGLTAPSNIPSGLIRMDGTGYLAKGKFWWDNDGKIYADPTALFLSFDVENEGASLSATILDIRDKQTEFANMWTEKTDSNGTKYLYTTYPLVTQGGVTMYAGTSGLDVEGIYDGLPIDGSTIYWENGILKAVGGGGVADSVAWADITGKPTFSTVATSGSYNDLLNKPTLLSSFTNDIGFVTESALSGKYLPLSGGDINGYIRAYNYRFINNSGTYLGMLVADGSDENTLYFATRNAVFYGILHSGNYTTYTYSQSTIDSKLSGYFPLSGGTITGGSGVYSPLIVKNSSSEVWIQFQDSVGSAHIGTNKGVPSIYLGSGSNMPILHSGNYSSYALPLTGGTLTGDLVLAYNSANNSSKGIRFDTDSTTLLYLYRKGSDLYFDGGGGYNKVYHSGNLTKLSQLTNDSGFITSSASISGNAATATKLATARTIWGQSFDGSGNVTGGLTNVSSIQTTGSAPIYLYRDSNKNGHYIVCDHNGFSISKCEGKVWKALGLNINYDTNNVGIGQVANSYKLHVNGSLNATTIYQNGSTLDSLLGAKLNSSSYTAADVLAKLKTVDGSGSGLDADTLDGFHTWQGMLFKSTVTLSDSTNTTWYVKIVLNVSYNSEPNKFIIRCPYNNINGTVTIDCDSWRHAEGYIAKVSHYNGCNCTGFSYVENSSNIAGASRGTLYLRFVGNSSAKTDISSTNPILEYSKMTVAEGSAMTFVDLTSKTVYSNYTYNASSATKLQTARTIWGQSFDGSGNVTGALTLGNKSITGYSGANILDSQGKWVILGSGIADNGFPTYIDGHTIRMRYGTSHTEVVRIDSSGNVGIGTTSPSTKLHVVQSEWDNGITIDRSVSGAGASIKVSSNGTYIGNFGINGNKVFEVNLHNGTSIANVLVANYSGNVGIGTTSPSAKLHVAGGILSTGGVTMYSQRSLKNVIDEDGLSLIELSVIKPTRYTWKDKRDERLHIGGIADDIQQVLPEVVYRTPDGVLTMDYGNAAFAIASSLIKPMIEHEERIARLERENRELKEEVKRLRA